VLIKTDMWWVGVSAGEPEEGFPSYTDEDATQVRTYSHEDFHAWLSEADEGLLRVVCSAKAQSAAQAERVAKDHIELALFPRHRRPRSYLPVKASRHRADITHLS
jgi:hypothetical protein